MANASPLSSPGAAAATAGYGRLLSLDVFRGATILAMILVNNPGAWGEKSQYWPLDHAPWHGWTPTDLIFPFFLFIVGTSLAYSLRKYRSGAHADASVYWRIIRRTAMLIFLGWMPSLLLRTIAAYHGNSFVLYDLRIFGVLVRIALVYLFTSLIVLNIPLRGQIALSIAVLLGYWATLAFLPDAHNYWNNLSNGGNIVSRFDRATIGEPHMYTYDRKTQKLEEPTEPEGFLSTFPAIVSALMGYWTGLLIQRRGINRDMLIVLALCGALCFEFGLLWNLAFPVNKKLWTSSFVMLTSGLAMQFLAGCILLFDIHGWRRLARPFEIVGVNAIFVFVCSGLLSIALSRNHVTWPPIDLKVMQSLWDAKESQSRSRIQQNLVNSKFTDEETNAALDRLTNRGWLSDKKESGVDFFTPMIKPAQTELTYHGWLYRTLFTSRIHDPKLASLGMALFTVAFWWFVCWLMSLFGLAIRV